MRRALTAILICSVAAASAGADAKELRRNVDAIKTMDQFGRCVGEQRLDAFRLMTTLPESKEEGRLARRISTSSCLNGGTLKFRASLLRGAVAEILMKENPRALHRADVKYTFETPSAEVTAAEPDAQRTAIALVLFGQCVAHENPQAVEALLQTAVESRAEMAAFPPLKGAMTACSTADFRADRFQMRGYLAEGAYRNAVTSRSD